MKKQLTNFIQQNKKPMGIIFSLGCVVVLIFVLCSTIFNAQKEETLVQQGTKITQSDFLLPQSNKVDATQTPLLYDFVSGCLGYKNNAIDMFKDDVFVICSKGESTSVYGVYKPEVTGNDCLFTNLPYLSNEPIPMNFQTDDQRNKFYSTMSDLADKEEIKKIQEGEYIFYIIPSSLTFDGQSAKVGWNGLDLNILYSNQTPGYYAKKYLNGEGYSIDMIRHCSNLEHIKKYFHYDFNDPFWDKYPFACLLKLHKKDGSHDCLYTTPIAQYDGAAKETHYTFTSIFYGDSLNLFNDYCSKQGYEIPDEAIQDPEYEELNSDTIKSLKKHSEDYILGTHPLINLNRL